VSRATRFARLLPVAAGLSLVAARAPAQRTTPDSTVYVLTGASRFQVRTGKAGLLGFAGHAHLIAARAVSGRVVYYPDAPASSRVEIVVLTESLTVLTPPDTAEIRKVTQAMQTEVLHVDRYPEIRFVSSGLTPISGGFRVQGALTLAGETRDVAVDVAVDIGPDTLRGKGTFDVKQTDYGIRPYRGGPGGTVRVADRVTFDFDAIGVAQPNP
jgi:polyisoprenoid-binding protein YceI